MQDENQTTPNPANNTGDNQQPAGPPAVMGDNMPMPDPLANFTPSEDPKPAEGTPQDSQGTDNLPAVSSISTPASANDDNKDSSDESHDEMTLPAPTDDSKPEAGLDAPASDHDDSSAADDQGADNDNKLEDTLSSYVAEPVSTEASSGDLDGIKQEAVKELAPLVDKLDQPAEERFRTLLSIIRATDDSKYLDAALKAAKEITDETKRAEALLDVINEVNYLSRQQEDNT